MEDKLNQAHIEVQQLKASVKNYEGMIDNYKSQVGRPVPAALPGQQRLLLWREVRPKASPQEGVFFLFSPKLGSTQCFVGPQVMKTRLEADEVAAQLERCDKENKILKDEMNKEIEAVLLPVLAFFPSQSWACSLSLLSALDASDVLLISSFSLLLPRYEYSFSSQFSFFVFLKKKISPAWNIQVDSRPQICQAVGVPAACILCDVFILCQPKNYLLSPSPQKALFF